MIWSWKTCSHPTCWSAFFLNKISFIADHKVLLCTNPLSCSSGCSQAQLPTLVSTHKGRNEGCDLSFCWLTLKWDMISSGACTLYDALLCSWQSQAANTLFVHEGRLAVMKTSRPESGIGRRMSSTKKPKLLPRAEGSPRRASTQRQTHYLQDLTPLLRGQEPSRLTLRRIEGSHRTEASRPRTPGSTTGTSSRRPRFGVKGRFRKAPLGLLVVTVVKGLASSLASLVALDSETFCGKGLESSLTHLCS